jgi:hypothetical protein
VALQSLKDLGRLTYRRFLELFRQTVGLLGRVISPSQGLYLHRTTQHRKTRTNIHALSGIRTYDPSNQPAVPRLRPHGHCWYCYIGSLIIYFPCSFWRIFLPAFRSFFFIWKDSLTGGSARRRASIYTGQHNTERQGTNIHAFSDVRNHDLIVRIPTFMS